MINWGETAVCEKCEVIIIDIKTTYQLLKYSIAVKEGS